MAISSGFNKWKTSVLGTSVYRHLPALLAIFFGPLAHGQAPGVPIESCEAMRQSKGILEQAEKLRVAGKLKLNLETTPAQLQNPIAAPMKLPRANRTPLPGRDIAAQARRGYLQLGWYFRCPHCNHWHTLFAGAYAIAPDALATCHHCVEQNTEMREGYLVAVNQAGVVLPVTAVLAGNTTLDAVILRVEGSGFTPLPLNDDVAPGDRAYCYSAPLGQQGYFSEGIVNRFYWSGSTGNFNTIEGMKNLRINVSTDWAPGSSGAAVLDQCGNVIGHVSTISPLSETNHKSKTGGGKRSGKKSGNENETQPDRFDGATLITLHSAVPARGVLALANPPKDDLEMRSVMAEVGPRLDKAIAARQWSQADKLADELERGLPASYRYMAGQTRFRVALAATNTPAAVKWAEKLGSMPDVDSDQLNELAWKLVTTDGLDKRVFTLAENLARRGVEAAPPDERSPVEDTLARALFRAGNKSEAIKVQEEALTDAPDELKPELTKTLKAYKKGILPPPTGP